METNVRMLDQISGKSLKNNRLNDAKYYQYSSRGMQYLPDAHNKNAPLTKPKRPLDPERSYGRTIETRETNSNQNHRNDTS